MTFRVTEHVKNTEAEAFIGLLDGGTLALYTGTQPALPTDAPTGTLIATITLPDPALDSVAVGGIADLAAVTPVNAVAAGTIGWCRAKTNVSATVFDGTVTLTGGGGDVEADVLAVLLDDLVSITSFSYQRS